MRRVLLTTSPTAFLHHGGGEREIHLLNDALNKSGVISDIYGPTSMPISAYSALIHFSMARGSEQLLDEAARSGIKLILWPNIWFLRKPTDDEIRFYVDFVDRFDIIVFRSRTEREHLERYVDLSAKTIVAVSYLVSPRFSSEYVSDIFRDSYGLEDYAIWPGIIEPQKNQLCAIQAFRSVPSTLVISGAVRDAEYMRRCMDAAEKNVLFIPAMPFGSELHLSALRHSSLFIELPLDFPGSSAIEAAVAGCDLLLSRSEWTTEVLAGRCRQVDPLDEHDVHTAISAYFDEAHMPKTRPSPLEYPTPSSAVQSLLPYLTA